MFLVLILAGGATTGYLWMRSNPAAAPSSSPDIIASTEQAPASNPLFPAGAIKPAATGDKAEIARLEEMVSHLEDQVKALTEENSALIQKLGSLGMKQNAATTVPTEPPGNTDDADYVGLGSQLLKMRELQELPIATITSTEEEVKAVILAWLRKIHQPNHGQREGDALYALGLIPDTVDTLPARAALLARQLTGWYNAETNTLQVIPPHKEPGGTLITTDPSMAIAYGNLLHHFAENLFGKDYATLTSDERQARHALIGGDAALTRFLRELSNPSAANPDALPPDDPDHPLNQIVVPDYLRQREVFPLLAGFEFAQTLHSISGWGQVSAAYKRQPESTAEIMDTERYLGDTRLPPTPVHLEKTIVKGVEPMWDDRLGQHTLMLFLRRYIEPEAAEAAATKWRGDRFIAYPSVPGSSQRGHAFWRIVTNSPEDASALIQAMQTVIRHHYEQPDEAPFPFTTKEGNRTLHLTQDKASITLTDTGSQEMAVALQGL